MTQEEKDLLLKDLCSRLPYGVFIQLNNKSAYRPAKLVSIDVEKQLYKIGTIHEVPFNFAKPYLFPLSSMTEEQKIEYNILWENTFIHHKDDYMNKLYEFYKENHLDNNGLIPKGLAINATNLNIY